MGWNDSDWIASFGGKGTFSSYDNPRADRNIRITAHHGDAAYMLWHLEHGNGHSRNHEFGINEQAGVDDDQYQSREDDYSEHKMDYGVTFWN